MPRAHWMSLSYQGKKTALADAVCAEDPWDCFDRDTLWEFLEESPEAGHVVQRYVDLRRLRTFFGNAELNDFDKDMGMDSIQYRVYSDRLFQSVAENLLKSDESTELAMLASIGATCVIKHSSWINAVTTCGVSLTLRFTRREFSDGRDDEFCDPFEDVEAHGLIDLEGEWFEFDGEIPESDVPEVSPADDIEDVEIQDPDKDMELRLQWDDDEPLIPGFDSQNDVPLGGLGDSLFDEDDTQN